MGAPAPSTSIITQEELSGGGGGWMGELQCVGGAYA